jgi:hypothetical protein
LRRKRKGQWKGTIIKKTKPTASMEGQAETPGGTDATFSRLEWVMNEM